MPGRSELVANEKELTIMIDYAHTPESLQNILETVKSYTQGNVICVFGCGGDRDAGKRPLMGEVAGKVADYTIIDRKEAIEKAIQMAHKKDLILIAGKGHELKQEIKGRKYAFDEREIVKEILSKSND